MRDIIVILFVLASSIIGFRRPWLGVLFLAVLAYLSPHRYAWGFSRTFPVYFILFSAVALGIAINGRDRQPFPWTRETLLFIALLAWFSVTTFFFADVPIAANEQWEKVMKIYIGIFPTLWMITSRDRLKWLIITIAMSFGMIGLKGGVFAILTGFAHRVYGPSKTFYGGNNEIALALTMSLPLLLLCAREMPKKVFRIGFYLTFVLSAISVVCSWSRGGLLSLVAVLLGISLTSKKKWLTVPVIIVGGIIISQHLPDEWKMRMETIKSFEEDKSAMGRIRMWEYAIERAARDPLSGGGFETFRLGERDVHSAYFEILGEHGYVGFIFWGSLLGGTIIALERLRRKSRKSKRLPWIQDYARAVQLSLLGYAVGGAFLGVAYWDYFYHLVAICALMKVMLNNELRSMPQ